MQTTEDHPFLYFIPEGCKSLVIGTFPPTRRNWSYDFFYPNKLNLFWSMMAAISGTNLQFFSGEAAVDERKAILTNLNAGVTDMGLKILRKANSSLDENIEAVEFMDIFSLLDQHPGIVRLIFTSSSGQSSAVKWFLQYLKQNDIAFKFPATPKPIYATLDYKGRNLQLIVLYSPSRRAANRISFELLVALYRQALLKC